jgi:hypothetical protein
VKADSCMLQKLCNNRARMHLRFHPCCHSLRRNRYCCCSAAPTAQPNCTSIELGADICEAPAAGLLGWAVAPLVPGTATGGTAGHAGTGLDSRWVEGWRVEDGTSFVPYVQCAGVAGPAFATTKCRLHVGLFALQECIALSITHMLREVAVL